MNDFDFSLPQQDADCLTQLQTGWDMGHGFLRALRRWQEDPHASGYMDYIVLDTQQTTRLQLENFWVTKSAEVTELCAQWPLPLSGIHVLYFAQRRCRLLVLSGSLRLLAELEASVDVVHLQTQFPDEQVRFVLQQIARVCRLGAEIHYHSQQTLLLSDLRRIGAAVLADRPGVAIYQPTAGKRQKPLWSIASAPKSAIVIGAGIAGIANAYALAERGVLVHLLDASSPNQGHIAAAMIPRFSADDDVLSRVSRAGILAAYRAWSRVPETFFRRHPALWIVKNETRAMGLAAQFMQLEFPSEWAQYWSASEVIEKTAGRLQSCAIHWQQSAWVQPEKLSTFLATHPNIVRISENVQQLTQQADGWLVATQDGRTFQADLCVCAHGSGIQSLLERSRLPVPKALQRSQVRLGDITILANDPDLQCDWMIAGNHTIIPTDVDSIVTGSTFFEPDASPPLLERLVSNRDYLERWWKIPAIHTKAIQGSWTGERVFTSHKLPVFGPWLEGLWLCSGYGTRGYSLAALYAETLVSALWRQTLPMERVFLKPLDG